MNWIQSLVDLPPVLAVILKMTVLLGVGWLLYFALGGRNPRWRVLLWRGIIVGLILLPVAELSLPRLQVPVAQPSPPPIGFETATTIPVEPAIPIATAAPPPLIEIEPSPQSFSIVEWGRARLAILLWAAWGTIPLFLVVRAVRASRRVRHIIKASGPAPDRIQALMEEVTATLKCRTCVEVRITPAQASPFLAGVFRPVIVLPDQMTDDAHMGELPAVLAHELAHLCSNDLPWIAAGKWLSYLLWFHPLAWKMCAAHATACEQVCDAVAADYVGDTSAYSGTLARAALEFVVDVPVPGAVPMIRTAEITRRLRNLKRGIQSAALSRPWVATSILLGSVILIGLGSLKLVYAERAEPDDATSLSVYAQPSDELAKAPSLMLKIVNELGEPIEWAEADLRERDSNAYGVAWIKAEEGIIHFDERELARRNVRRTTAGWLDVFVRAEGYAPKVLSLEWPAARSTLEVVLGKGRRIELTLEPPEGMKIPDSLEPATFFVAQAPLAMFGIEATSQRQPDRVFNLTPMEKLDENRFVFHIPKDHPDVYFEISEPGFLRGFIAGPYGTNDFPGERVTIELPVPGRLEARIRPPSETEYGGVSACSFVVSRMSTDFTLNGLPLAFQCFFRIMDGTSGTLKLIDLPPGTYTVIGQTRAPSTDPPPVLDISWSQAKTVNVQSDAVSWVDFSYPNDPTPMLVGDGSINIKVARYDNSPAAHVPYKLIYEREGAAPIVVREGKAHNDGTIRIEELASGSDAPAFQLEIAGSHTVSLKLTDAGQIHDFLFELPPMEGDTVPDISLYDLKAERDVKISDFQGKVVLLEFWATWCGPCQGPMEHLNTLAAKRSSDWQNEAVILAASIDTGLDVLRDHVKKKGWTNVLHAWCKEGMPGHNSVAAKAFGIQGVPTTFLIDRDGKIKWRGHPANLDTESEIDELIMPTSTQSDP